MNLQNNKSTPVSISASIAIGELTFDTVCFYFGSDRWFSSSLLRRLCICLHCWPASICAVMLGSFSHLPQSAMWATDSSLSRLDRCLSFNVSHKTKCLSHLDLKAAAWHLTTSLLLSAININTTPLSVSELLYIELSAYRIFNCFSSITSNTSFHTHLQLYHPHQHLFLLFGLFFSALMGLLRKLSPTGTSASWTLCLVELPALSMDLSGSVVSATS